MLFKGTAFTIFESKDGIKDAIVTVTGGKIKVDIPEVYAFNMGNPDDSVKVSASITK